MSKPKNKRQIRNRFVPRLGRLEDRLAPAGNVAAAVFDGILYIAGDDGANQISVSGDGRSATLASLDGTTLINGQAGPVTLEGIRKGFHVVMNGGDDFLSLQGLEAFRHLNIDLGDGNDRVHVLNTVSYQETNFHGRAGNNIMMLFNSVFYDDMIVDTGEGNDMFVLNQSAFFGQTYLNAAGGLDTLSNTGNYFAVGGPIVGGFDDIPVTPPPNPTPTAPVANADSATVSRGGTAQVNVAANDTASQGTLNLSSVTITRTPMFGTATVTGNGSVSYTSTATGTSAVDSFQYTIRDTNGTVSNAATVSITIRDTTSPTVTVSTTATNPTGASPIIFNVDFNEDVAMLTESDITVVNGTVGLLTRLNARSYRVEIDPTADGTVSVSLAAGVVNDLNGNPNLASNTVSVVFDDTNPTLAINPLTTNDTTPTITGTVEAGSTVSVTVNGQTVAATVTGTTWSATLTTALADGTYSINATATDTSNNESDASLADGLVIDTVVPTVAITTTATDPTNLAVIPFTATFSEGVTGFEVGDITVVNGAVSNLVAVSATVYTFDVTPNGDGLVTVTVAAAAGSDAAGNTNAETSFSITVEGLPPTPAITTTATSPTNLATIPFTVTFNEDVTGFDATDIVVGNGAAANFVAVDARTYTFDVTPTADGDVTIDIAAGAAQDGGGNDSTAATFTITSDRTVPAAPVITGIDPADDTGTVGDGITSNPAPAIVGTADAGATIEIFADSGTGNVSLGTTTAGAGGDWSFTPTANLADGTYAVTAIASDAAGNDSPASTAFNLTINANVPTPAVTTTATDPTNLDVIPFTVTFNEDVTGFELSDLVVTNGAASNFVAVDAQTYTFDVTPTGDGVVVVTVPADVAQNGTGTGNAVGSLSITSERMAPTTAITTTATNPTNLNPIPFTVTFSENVTGFDLTDVSVVNGAASNFVAVDGRTYTFDVAPTADGTVTIDIASGVAEDAAGNDNSAATLSIESDTTTPAAPVITGIAPVEDFGLQGDGVTNVPSPTLTGTAEAGSTVSVFADSGSGAVQIATVVATAGGTWAAAPSTPLADGTYTVTATATDSAGSVSPPSASFTLGIDTVAPVPTFTTLAPNPTNASPISMTLTFSENTFGFSFDDFVLTNATVANLSSLNPQTYFFDLIPTGDGVVTIDLVERAGNDIAGNFSTAATFSIESDRTLPTGAINQTGVQSIGGTAADVPTGVASVRISLFNGAFYWNGTDFSSPTEMFFDVVTTDDFATWTYALNQVGTYTINAQIRDGAGNLFTTQRDVTVT